MIAGDRNGVELRHILGSISKDISDDFHRELRRIDVSVAHHKLLKDIILYGSLHLFQFDSLLQACYNVEGKNRKNGSVHCH